jgi:DNA-binding CsgD family transcriptional regulator
MINQFGLTKKEFELCQLICKGFTQANIAKRTGRKPKTINNHMNNIYIKLELYGVSNAASLGVFFSENKLITHTYVKTKKQKTKK